MLVNCNDTEKVKQLEGQYLTNPYHNDKIKYKLKPLVLDDDVYRCIVEDRMGDITDKDAIVDSSEIYPQGDKKKYWFGYRDKRFEDIEACDEQYMILGCRNKTL